jgi:hypothetical protein
MQYRNPEKEELERKRLGTVKEVIHPSRNFNCPHPLSANFPPPVLKFAGMSIAGMLLPISHNRKQVLNVSWKFSQSCHLVYLEKGVLKDS